MEHSQIPIDPLRPRNSKNSPVIKFVAHSYSHIIDYSYRSNPVYRERFKYLIFISCEHVVFIIFNRDFFKPLVIFSIRTISEISSSFKRYKHIVFCVYSVCIICKNLAKCVFFFTGGKFQSTSSLKNSTSPPPWLPEWLPFFRLPPPPPFQR